MHCDFFKIYCAPSNLGITRTWICRLNFAQRLFFRLEVLERAWNLRLGTPSSKSFPEDLRSGFLRPEKINRPQLGLNPRTLHLEASTLPRGRQVVEFVNNNIPRTLIFYIKVEICFVDWFRNVGMEALGRCQERTSTEAPQCIYIREDLEWATPQIDWRGNTRTMLLNSAF